MNKKQLLLRAMSEKYHRRLLWYYTMFTIRKIGYKDKYLEVAEDAFYILFGEEKVRFETANVPGKDSVLSEFDTLFINPDDIDNLSKPIKTSVGLFIANKVKLEEPFGDTIPYKNKMFTDKDIEKIIPEILKSKEITIQQYLDYTLTTSLIVSTAKIFTVSGTEKTITPHPEIKKIKTALINEYNEKYGKDWQKDNVLAIQFKDKLGEHDKEYLKDDPSYGKMLSGKLTNNSRPRLFGVFGVEYGFDKTGQDGKFVINSLAEGYPKDNDLLAILYNSARAASYDRGAETQSAGSTTKDMIRPTGGLEIIKGDCGTTTGRKVVLTEHTAYRYVGSYILENGKTILMNNPKDYIGKKLTVRSPMHCISLQEGEKYCSHCMTNSLENLKNGIMLLMIEGGGVMLNAKMKSMHKATKNTMVFNIFSALR